MSRVHFVSMSSVAIVALLFAGCSKNGGGEPAQPSADDDVFEIYVINYPLQYFAERIVGDKAKVVFPAPADGDPAFWSPDQPAIAAYQEADLILLNGANYAKWIAQVTLPETNMVDTSAGFKKKYIVIEDAVSHRHGPEGEHAHRETDFNTWLAPDLAIMHAEAIAEAVGERLPDDNDEFQANLAALKIDLEALGASLTKITADHQGEPLLASHPVYNYLARYCGWNLKSMHWEPEEMPGEDQWNELDTLCADHPARWMIWEAEPAAAIRAELEERGIRSVVFTPCGNTPESEEFLETMRRNVGNLKPVFESF